MNLLDPSTVLFTANLSQPKYIDSKQRFGAVDYHTLNGFWRAPCLANEKPSTID